MMLLSSILAAFLQGAAIMKTNPFDKIGFDLEVIGRQREITLIEETTRLHYKQAGLAVNIAIWNMHVPEKHDFDDILDSGLKPMGQGGGFRIVVFQGKGYIKNEGALGAHNWHCSGRKVEQSGNGVCVFESTTPEKSLWHRTPSWAFWLCSCTLPLFGWVFLR
jgi:hypothetical protein